MFLWLKRLFSKRSMAHAMEPQFMPPVLEHAHARKRVPTLVRPPNASPQLRVVGPRRAAANRTEPVPYDCIPAVDYPCMPRAFSARDDWPAFVSPSAERVSSGGGGDFAGAGATSSWSDTSDSCSSSSDTSGGDSGSSCSTSD